MIEKFYKTFLVLAGLCIPAILLLLIFGFGNLVGIMVIGLFVFLAIGIRAYPSLKGFSFTVWVFASVALAMFYPSLITEVRGYNTENLIVPLIQVIMFGMGTSLSLGDFAGVVKMPKAVGVGLVCQYSIMPVVGVSLALLFGFPPEIAAGIVLVGASPSGVASNVMAFIAKGNLALSVTLTAIATMLAPLTTPFLMQVFAGQFIPIDFYTMMVSIFKMVIVPIVAGLAFNRIFRGKAGWLHRAMPLISMAGIVIIIGIITASGRDHLLSIGLLLIIAAVIHNITGYTLGYWGCRLVGMDEKSCRTIALEVGMQNAGLASGIAVEMGRVATMGLAPAVFGPWMNISGSFLANWWRDHTPAEEDQNPVSSAQNADVERTD
ncbi:MAG: bile acid:sodium symporter family protein [Balneolaceae bacterium]|nr:MAG: bile acid:sodium symporter family protein [Balneolaceae bacterium]